MLDTMGLFFILLYQVVKIVIFYTRSEHYETLYVEYSVYENVLLGKYKIFFLLSLFHLCTLLNV